MTSNQIFSHPAQHARPYAFVVGRTAFSGPVSANTYGPHMGLSSMVLQRKRSQGRTGHMIKSIHQMCFCYRRSRNQNCHSFGIVSHYFIS